MPNDELLRYLMKYDDISILNDIYFSVKLLTGDELVIYLAL